MLTAFTRRLPVAVLAAALLTGCTSDAGITTDTAVPAPAAGQPSAQPSTASVVGLLTSADNDKVVIGLPDGSGRTFGVRPEDAPRLGIRHLASHAGLTDIGFRITYVTVDGKDYVVAAEETAPPQ
jgi:O-acetyl-ADP-ribose deacetylase (regulator of RNase III)